MFVLSLFLHNAYPTFSCSWKKVDLIGSTMKSITETCAQGGGTTNLISRSVTLDTESTYKPTSCENSDSSDDDYLPDLSSRITASQSEKKLDFSQDDECGEKSSSSQCDDQGSSVFSCETRNTETVVSNQCMTDSGIVDCDNLAGSSVNTDQVENPTVTLSDGDNEKAVQVRTPDRTMDALKTIRASKLTPKLMALSMSNTPKLSCTNKSMVSLDSESEGDTVEETVFDKLVDKVLMHSRSKHKQMKTVEMR